jgi:hypothetical protein
MSPYNKFDGTFGNYGGAQEQKTNSELRKFDILRVPSKQIPTKKCWTLSFVDLILL